MSLTIWSYTLLHLSTIDIISYHVKMLMFYNVPTTGLTFVGQKTGDIYTGDGDSIPLFLKVTDTKYII